MVTTRVRIELSSASVLTPANLGIYTLEGALFTIGSNARLYIDSLVVSQAAAAGVVQGWCDVANTGVVDNGERIFVTGGVVGSLVVSYPQDGIGCAMGFTPKVVAAAAGTVNITGSGRVVVE